MPKSLLPFTRRAVALGADEAKIIRAASVVTAPWVRLKCQFGCGGYGASLCCPPHTPDHRAMAEVLASYRRAILFHCTGRTSPTRIAIALEREVFLAGWYRAFGLGAGPCPLCRDCDLDACRHPEKARPSMEACGIDVYATARNNGYPIRVLEDSSCEQNRYGLVLVD